MKPENLLVRAAGRELGSASSGAGGGLHVRLIDFGSAIDAHSLRHLYGPGGPSDREQTPEYAPPEAVLGRWGTLSGCSKFMDSATPVCHSGLVHYMVPSWAQQSMRDGAANYKHAICTTRKWDCRCSCKLVLVFQ